MSDTEQIARRYYNAWTAGDTPTVTALLASDFQFMAGDFTIDGRDAFLDSGAFPKDATTSMVAEAYQGDIGFQMYDATRGEHTVRIVEQLTVRNEMIASSVFVTDQSAFNEFLGR